MKNDANARLARYEVDEEGNTSQPSYRLGWCAGEQVAEVEDQLSLVQAERDELAGELEESHTARKEQAREHGDLLSARRKHEKALGELRDERDKLESRLVGLCSPVLATISELTFTRRQARDERDKLKGEKGELLEVCKGARVAISDAFDAWDADKEARVGKILQALLGRCEGYRPDTDAFARCTSLERSTS